LITEVGTHLGKDDIISMRMVNKRFFFAVKPLFGKVIVQNRTIFPTFNSVAAFIALLDSNPALPVHVRSITLVAEGLKEHEYGPSWAWEILMDRERFYFADGDHDIINYVNYEHTKAVASNTSFLIGGGYRTMLSKYSYKSS
jgi:hypothetical protein